MELGKRIEFAVKESGLQVTEFATKIGMTRGSVYSLFRRKRISSEILITIDNVLGTEFSNPKLFGTKFAVVIELKLGFHHLPKPDFINDLNNLIEKYSGFLVEK